MQQRYYDPQLGRFLSIDPMVVDTSTSWNFNRYNYAANNPYRFTDPDGRMTAEDRMETVSVRNQQRAQDVRNARSGDGAAQDDAGAQMRKENAKALGDITGKVRRLARSRGGGYACGSRRRSCNPNAPDAKSMKTFFKFLYALGERTQRGARYGDPIYMGTLYATIVMCPVLYGVLQSAAKIAGPVTQVRLDELVFGNASLGYAISVVLAIAITDLFLKRNRVQINSDFDWIPITPTWGLRIKVTAACMLLALLLTAVAEYFPMASVPVSLAVFVLGGLIIRRWRECTSNNREG